MTTSNMIKIDSKILKNISEIAKKDNTTETKLINQMLETALKFKRKNENKIPEHLLMNKDTYNPDPELTEELIGSIEVKEPFDTKKAIAKARGIK